MKASSAISLLVLVFAAAGALHAGEPTKQEPFSKKYAVTASRDLTYWEIPSDPDRDRHQLDVYRPKGLTKAPVLFFVHGGAWTISSKDDVLGIYGYGTIGKCLAERGLVVVMTNYRLSPSVKHPEHIKDVAHAFAWTCQHVAEFGGDPERIIVVGHSAGGHLVSLLTTDPSYLKAEGRSQKDIRGVISISGVYSLEELDLKQLVAAPCCQCLDFRDCVNPITSVFGTDPAVLKQAAPITQVRPGLPPFLLVNGSLDYGPLRQMTKEFAAALKDNDCVVETKVIPWRTHETEVFDIPRLTAEPKMIEAIVEFVARTKSAAAQ